MPQITHRELRNRSGQILREVNEGKSFEITNNGVPVARLMPIEGNVIDQLIEAGKATQPVQGPWPKIKRAQELTTQEVLKDIRRDY